MELSPPRGTADLLPPMSERMWALYERAADLAHRYGHAYVESAALEHSELFVRTAGRTSDIVEKEMYTFTDRSGRPLTLRPEGTAPLVRAYLARRHDLPSPFKAFYVELTWRYGRPQSGRLREYRSFGVEVLGVEAAAADAEVVGLANEYLRDLGLERWRLEVNSIGDENCRPAYREELLSYLESRRDAMRDEHRDRFRDNPLRVLDCKDDACSGVAADAPKISDRLCGPCKEHFEDLLRRLGDEGIVFVHQPTLVRGLDYYTRTAFEFVSEVLSEQQGTLCGGGRYDGLAEILGGPHTPGVGFGMGLDRVLLALEAEGVRGPSTARLDCFVVGIGEGRAYADEVTRRLRQLGISAATSFEERPLGAQLRMADRLGARFAVIAGDREAAAQMLTLRRLSDGDQREFGFDEVVAWVTSHERSER